MVTNESDKFQSFAKGEVRTIRFKNVKQLKVRIYDKRVDLPELPIEFDKLEEVEFYCYWLVLERIKFARPNNLKKLKVYMGYEPMFDDSDIMKIVDQWPNLEEISIQIERPEQVLLLMENLEHLKKIIINDLYTDYAKELVGLHSKIGEEWKMNEKVDDEIVITKT